MSSQIKEFKKYSFNQYSSTPQLYTSNNQQVTTYGQYTSAPHNGSQPQQVVTDYGGYQTEPPQQQPRQQQLIGQFPPPPQQQEAQVRPQLSYIGKKDLKLSLSVKCILITRFFQIQVIKKIKLKNPFSI